MRKSDRPPNYLIDKIVRHTNIIITAPYGSVKYMDAARLLKKEVKKLETFNEACSKRHCLCHQRQKHWKDPSKKDGETVRPESVLFNGNTPCKGYIPQYERKKYNVNY